MEDKDLMKEFLDTLKNNSEKAFDFICNNGYKMRKDELKDICKELLYAIWKARRDAEITFEEETFIYKVAVEELSEWYNNDDD